MIYEKFIINRLKNKEVHIVASGPSLVNFDYSVLNNKNVICVNHSYKKIKNELWTVAIDSQFIKKEDPKAPYKTTLLSRKLENYPIINFNICQDKNKKPYFSFSPADGVYHKKCSGSVAITTAIHAGASKIYLYGFDCDLTNKVHATDDEFNHKFKQPNRCKNVYKNMIEFFDGFPDEVKEKVINMNINSKITAFNKEKGY